MLAAYLKQLRQRSQLTCGGWASASGISRTTLWRWEQGKALPRDEELKLALAAVAASAEEQKQAFGLLLQERVGKGVGAAPLFTGTGLKRNELLRALRLRCHWTQREAAERLGVNRVTLASWEVGDHWPEPGLLHHVCQLYEASSDELVALTTLSLPSSNTLPADPTDITWDDIETYDGDFAHLELRFLTQRARLAQISHPYARERELACTLDYLHSLVIQSRGGEVRRELRRIAKHPALLASPTLFARHQRLYAVVQEQHPKGHDAAEQILRSLLDRGDTVPLSERCRALGEWAERRADRGDLETALRLSTVALADAHASGDAHLHAIGQRQYTAVLINIGKFTPAVNALGHFPTHTPLFAVQKLFTYALLLQKTGSLKESASAYGKAAQAAHNEGMTGYAKGYARLAASVAAD